MNVKLFAWRDNSAQARADAQEFAKRLKIDDPCVVDLHIWNDVRTRVTAVEWR